MDIETENRLAALLMDEARRLRRQADKKGVHAYLGQSKARGRPNSRFLTATVVGVQQANRSAEVSEMWRVREKELELDAKLKGRAKNKSICSSARHHYDPLRVGSSSKHEEAKRNTASCSSSKRVHEDCYSSKDGDLRDEVVEEFLDPLHVGSSSKHEEANRTTASCSSSIRAHEDYYSSEEGGLRDEEVEEFLHSRVKRGRGAVGSRMDEPGPLLPSTSLTHDGQLSMNPDVRVKEERERHVLGPEKPISMNSHILLKDTHDMKAREIDSCRSKKHHSEEKQGSKEKSRRKKEKKS